MFSDILKNLRNEKRISQPQLAKAVGVSPGNVSDWETGRSKPGYVALIALSRFFEVSVDYLLELDGPPVKTGITPSAYTSRQGITCDGVPLSQMEADMVAMFRILGDRDRETAFDFVTMLYEKASGEKGSVYSTYIDDENERKKSGPLEGREARDGTA